MTETQARILAAVEQGFTTTRSIATAIGLSANSNIHQQLHAMAAAGHIVLEETPSGLRAYSGADFCAGWDLAARLAGNKEA